jgi:hypothetical protein
MAHPVTAADLPAGQMVLDTESLARIYLAGSAAACRFPL